MSGEAEPNSRDDHGTIRVGKTQAALDSVIAFWTQGDSPEAIRSQCPSLTLAEVYAAITWVLTHEQELATYMKEQEENWDKWRQRSESQPSALRDRLRASMKSAPRPA